MNRIKAVIFDCDGVMFDTVKANRAYYNSILREFGKPDLTDEQFAYAQMHTAEAAIAHLFQDTEDLGPVRAFCKEMGYAPFIKEMEMEPYLLPLLKNLKPRYRTAVATNRSNTMPLVMKAFALEEWFDLVVSALDVTRPKPAPDPLFKVLGEFGLKPEEALYVGDSALDEAAAHAAGIPLVACRNPALTADFHIQSLKEIEDILKNGFNS